MRRPCRLAPVLCLLLALLGCRDEGPSGSAEPGLGEERVETYADAGPTRLRFTDRTAASGLGGVLNHSGRPGVKEYLLEAVGPGLAWFDYDNDGLLDLYVPDGDVFENYVLTTVATDGGGPRVVLAPRSPRRQRYDDRLFRNRGDGTFEDVTKAAGIDDPHWSFGATAFDYDGDGWTDVFVANFGHDRLWRNNGDGTFADVAPAVGLTGDEATWSTCAAVGDVDDDGRLDVFVAAYADPAAEVNRQRLRQGLPISTPVETINGRACPWRSVPAYCGPRGLVGQHDRLYLQTADGTFEDATDALGLRPRVPKYAFSTLMFDLDGDGLLDIYVANDSEENFLWRQERDASGQIRFEEVADTFGAKYGHNLAPQASMGAFTSDLNHDGWLDVFITNFSHDYNNIYLGVGGGTGSFFYRDKGLQVMGEAAFYDLSWGCGAYDFDNDADLDVFVANGHVYAEVDEFESVGTTYRQLNALFECMDAERLGYREVGPKAQRSAPAGVDPADLFAGDGMEDERCSRAAAFADFDNDGRIDIVVSNLNDRLTVLRNTSDVAGRHWIKLVLRQEGENRDGVGAMAEVRAGGTVRRFPAVRLTSFLGTDDPRIHVGLGEHETCDVRVVWPGPAREATSYEGLEAGALWQLDRAGEATRLPLPAATAGGAGPAGDGPAGDGAGAAGSR